MEGEVLKKEYPFRSFGLGTQGLYRKAKTRLPE